jgi:hypothetical protein
MPIVSTIHNATGNQTMSTIYESHAMKNANSIERVVELVNKGTYEGIEGVEFTPEMLAGCYAYNAACDSGNEIDKEELEAQLYCLADGGANFDASGALEYAIKLSKAA